MKRTSSRWVSLFAVVAMAGVAQRAAGQPSPNTAFEEGRRLIDENCGDCLGSTKENLEKGLANVRQALAEGYADTVEAYRALADGLMTLQFVFAVPDSPAQAEVGQERRRVVERLVELRPDDPEILDLYASVLSDEDARLDVYRRTVWLDPRHAPAYFGMGVLLQRRGERDEAIVMLRLALEFSEAAWVESYSYTLIESLEEAGRTRDIEDVRRIVEAKTSR